MNSLKAFFTQKSTILAFVGVLVYQVIMMGIFLPAYSAMPQNISNLRVGIVNEDTNYGAEIEKQMLEELPFVVETNRSLEEAQRSLEDRDIYLLIHIPQDFTENLISEDKKTTINFTINQANPSLVSTTMSSVVQEISSILANQFETSFIEEMLVHLNIPEEQAIGMADMAKNQFEPNITIINEQRQGMHNQMAPILLTIAANVGSMIFSMFIVSSLDRMRPQIGKWKAYGSMQLAILTFALIGSLPSLGILFALENYGLGSFITVWGTLSLLTLAAIQIFTISTMLLGQPGMLFNLTFLLIQVIAGAGVIPYEANYKVMQWLSHISPAYYANQANFIGLFGGNSVLPYLLGLLGLAIGGAIITSIIQGIKKENAPLKKSLF
ncbi:YhgE/Pip domain-containing protein [Bacillus horti]|uniref:YhgE/Pip-like protein n=2 Tax=Caldalkalibacillus horti TaxID=77523 RepID=A0ABT9W1H4_9BACI|nr:ABC transporter permease [Bacillus horti]MDQ0166939.1 YhgE/Pip-like protein [Bacillus horti]